MSNPRLAFIGSVDAVSHWLLRSISRVGTFEAICDRNLTGAAEQYHARWTFDDSNAMLRETEPDGVVLACPLTQRARLIKHCLTSGAAVLVPGPPGTAGACKRIASFAKLSGRIVLAGSAIRVAPAVALAKRLLDSGQFGPPILMTLRSTRRGLRRSDAGDIGPVPIDQAFEAVELIHHLIGPVQRVFAVAHEDGPTVASAMTTPGVPVSIVFHPNGPTEAVGVEIEIRAADGGRLMIDTACQLSCRSGSKLLATRRTTMATADPAVELGDAALLGEFSRHLRATRAGAGLIGPVAAITASAQAVLASIARGRPTSPKLTDSRPARPEKKGAEIAGPA